MSEGRVRVGIGGWSFPPWRETFYPRGLPQARELDYASRQFGAIEINATFYGRQSASSWRNWAVTAPDGFKFTVKGSRFCVSRPKLADAGEAVTAFLGQGLVELGDKLGPILWMLAARRSYDREDVSRFLALLPREFDGIRLQHALEPRHDSFLDEDFYASCREHDVAVVFGDSDTFPCIDADTASFAYWRLQRMQEDVPTGYEPPALQPFAVRAQEVARTGRDAYIFMINGAKVRAPSAAMRLQAELGIAPTP